MEARAGAAGGQRPRRGPAPIASFDHDVSDESSPETKPTTFQLPEIREDLSAAGPSGLGPGPAAGAALAVRETGEARARSHSSPGLVTPAAPRIDISRASSSSHQDSRDSSPELALFAGADPPPDHLGFREDGALELRSSTEELAFLEPDAPAAPPPPPAPPPPAAPGGSASRRHSRKDSQGSEAALLAISGRTSRLSSVGSQCSALSHVSHVSCLSVVSGASRSPSPHKMLLETSFCGPKPIEAEPEVCGAAVEERLLGIAKRDAPAPAAGAGAGVAGPGAVPDARDRREVRTEARVEAPRPPRTTPAPDPPIVAITPAPPASATTPTPAPADDDKREKETRNRRARSRERRDREPEVYSSRNRSKDVIRIKLKPDDGEDDDDDDEEEVTGARKPDSLELGGSRPRPRPRPEAARSPSPSPVPAQAHSRKSSFCSLFKSRETIASPDSPSDALRRKKSVSEGRARSKSRERGAPPAAAKLRGSVLALFKAPRRSATASPEPPSRAASPAPAPAPTAPPPPALRHLKYYEDTRDGIIHIPLRTPPDDETTAEAARPAPRPASAPCARPSASPAPAPSAIPPMQRTVLPDGSIIIPLHSPTEKEPPIDVRRQVAAVVETQSKPKRNQEHTPETDSRTPSVIASPVVSATPATSTTPATPATPLEAGTGAPEPPRSRRKERLVFTTNVGSTEQVFSTQFSITKTPSVTSEISESFPSLPDEPRTAPSCPVLRDTHIAADPIPPDTRSLEIGVDRELTEQEGASGRERDSSESEGSSDAGGAGVSGAAGRGGEAEAEARGLVVQESFEEELPFVPTTLPLERSLALPMLPVRERGPHTSTTARVQRPRAAPGRGGAPPAPGAPALPPAPPPPAGAPPPPPHERLRIRLPRRASASAPSARPADATHARPSRSRTRSGSDARKTEWIDFSEVPERRPAARRIQTLPPREGGAGGGGDQGAEFVVSYVEPEQCRCECHRAASPARAHDYSSPEGEADGEEAFRAGGAGGARPFTADLDVADCARS